MSDVYKKVPGTESAPGSTGAHQKYYDLAGDDGHALSVYVEDGALTIALGEADIEIGAVELKDATSTNRAVITAGGDLQITMDGETLVLPVGNTNMAASTPVTIASDDTLITAIKTALELLDNAISGTEMQVDVVAELPAGTQIVGKVGIDQTTPGTTNKVVASVASGGIASGAVASGAIVDGADVAEGATTDSAVVTDTTGTISGKLRGLVKWAFERMPASLGQKAMAASLPVTIASDDSLTTAINAAVAALSVSSATAASATAADATVTLSAPGVGVSNTVSSISWSYSAAPTGGQISVYINAVETFSWDITTGGPGFLPFNPPMKFASNEEVLVKLKSGGGAVVGKLTVVPGTV